MAPRHTPRTKIVCTLGPASSTKEQLRGLVQAGLNVARLNFSHGTHAQHAELVTRVREVSEELGCPVAILGDLQGPRIRIGDLPETIELRDGEDLTLVHEGEERAPDEIPVTYESLADDVGIGDRILINDGLIELLVLDVRAPRVRARIVHGGPLKSHKGLNLPGVQVSAPSLTEKDRADVVFAVEHQLEYLALSFVRRPEDIEQLRTLIPRDMLIVAKIEKDSALENIEAILRATDAVMVARGDLGVELPFEEVPGAQKHLIALANREGRPVITATQMLESMITHPRPTRAEASDVANAILDGTDAVMLSAETAAGSYPRLAVEAMVRIIREVETNPPAGFHREERRSRTQEVVPTEDAIAAATVAAAKSIGTPLVVTITKSGFTARVVSSRRPDVPVLALTDSPRTCRQLSLVWGVVPQLVPIVESYEAMIEEARRAILARELAVKGDRIVVTAGVPFGRAGTTNLLRVEIV